MCKFSNLTANERREILVTLIDDMAAAAHDRSSQGYTTFMQCRKDIMETLDKIVSISERRDALIKNLTSDLDAYYDMKH